MEFVSYGFFLTRGSTLDGQEAQNEAYVQYCVCR